ncbi:hypothetical protein LIER_17456 [Lithospermum erythrorhizon]|uniref:Uncharacterized protein n=1 Tax=Lithospermum erythrorhizon TaxID=34254 RepID=A0AAV3QBQ3_LITER
MIISQIGRPLYADRNTSELRNLGYARVCVEIKVENQLFDEVHVRYVNGYIHKQKVENEWVPLKCLKCRHFGHKECGSEAKKTQVYVQKVTTESYQQLNLKHKSKLSHPLKRLRKKKWRISTQH